MIAAPTRPTRSSATPKNRGAPIRHYLGMPPRQTARPTAVDRTGHPDDLVGTAEATRILGYAQPDKLPAQLLEQADNVERNPDGSIKRRSWKRSTLWRWADIHLAVESTKIDGRPALDRTGIAAHTGFAISAVATWIAGRDTNGFPNRVEGRWYYTDEIDEWVRQHIASYRPTDSVRSRTDELIDIDEVARMAGFSSKDSLRQNPLWHILAERNDPTDNEKSPRGRPRRRWPRRTVQQIIDADQPRRGRRPGTTRIIDRTGDPNELVGATEAARVLGYQHRSGLPEKVLDRTDVPSDPGPRKWRRSTLWSIADEEEKTAQP